MYSSYTNVWVYEILYISCVYSSIHLIRMFRVYEILYILCVYNMYSFYTYDVSFGIQNVYKMINEDRVTGGYTLKMFVWENLNFFHFHIGIDLDWWVKRVKGKNRTLKFPNLENIFLKTPILSKGLFSKFS